MNRCEAKQGCSTHLIDVQLVPLAVRRFKLDALLALYVSDGVLERRPEARDEGVGAGGPSRPRGGNGRAPPAGGGRRAGAGAAAAGPVRTPVLVGVDVGVDALESLEHLAAVAERALKNARGGLNF